MQNIYRQALNGNVNYECSCAGIGVDKWDELMKGAKKANKKIVTKIALLAGVIDEYQAKQELKRPFYNTYNHYRTKTHIIYVNSLIEHFIRVN